MMTPRERILSSIEHRQPDHVPVDLGATPSSGISATAYGNLKKHLGFGGHTQIYDVVQQLAQPEEQVLGRLGVDVVDIGRVFNDQKENWYDIQLKDGQTAQYPSWFRPIPRSDGSFDYKKHGKVIASMPKGGTFFDQTYFPYEVDYPDSLKGLPEAMGMVLWQALAHSPWDHASSPTFWEDFRSRALEYRKSTDRALMVVCGCNLFEWGTFLRRIDNFLADLLSEPEEVEKLLDALMAIHLQSLKKVVDAVGDVCDILRFGDDLGMTHGLFMSPQIYRDIFKPRHTELNDYVHKHSGMKTFLHSCGSIYRVLPDLIEAGYDIVNPVQTNCFEMDPKTLKAEFGNDITFWGGGCDTATVMNKATPEEVRRHVLERLEIFCPGGGFVFNPIHNILPEVPPENILAAFDAVKEFNGV